MRLVPPLLREFGRLRDQDECFRGLMRRAGSHAFLAAGSLLSVVESVGFLRAWSPYSGAWALAPLGLALVRADTDEDG